MGLRGRPVRTVLSATGIALGVATIVSVLGISNSSRAQLMAQIDSLGTNLLTVSAGQSFSGQTVSLPATAPSMVRRVGPVLGASAIGDVGSSVNVYRNDHISAANTNAISVYAAQDTLLATLQGELASGRFLNGANVNFPVTVLGTSAAAALGIDSADGGDVVWLGGRWFTVIGILQPLTLAPELDRSALVGYPMARRALGFDGAPAEIYVRTDPAQMSAVEGVLAATVDPAAPQDVAITNPSDALIARADAASAFQGLFLALGGVALVVGGVGVANVMVIAVLERRGEIGLRRALGARRVHVAVQFVSESVLLAGLGGTSGAVLGTVATSAYAALRHWSTSIPLYALAGAVAAAVLVGAVAGLYPASRAARLSPTEALRAV